MNTFLILLLYIGSPGSIGEPLSGSKGNRAPVSCEVCDVTDPNCVKGGARTVCDVAQQYCLTEVTDTLGGDRSVGRKCADLTECQQKFAVTEERLFCYEVDMGNLRADVTCSFCCQGDLCNQGPDLIPPAQFLYNGELNVTRLSTPVVSTSEPAVMTSSMTDSATSGLSTVTVDMCEVCDVKDQDCFHGGTPTSCDVDHAFCMTTVHDNFPNNMTVSRSCVNESVCYQKWYMETSWRHYCYDIDQGELYFPVDCNFCCVGDLCNSGTLVPDPDTLYRPPEPTNATDLSTSSETQNTPTPTVPTTPHLAVCDVCSRDDLGCVHGGRPTLCDPDRPYCQTTVYEDSRFNQYAERSCADLNICEKDWINHTSGRPYCLEVDKGPLFYPNYCSFCCVGDQCNNGSLVPSIETLYYPMVIPSTSIPLSTTHPDITEATSGVIKTTSDVTQTTSEVIKTSSDVTQATSDVTQTSTESTTIHRPICDTCSPDDPQCMTGGQPTMCDLDTPFCMTSVIEDMSSKQTARRMCVNETACQVDWLQETSSKYYCFQVDQGPLYFANTCSFCCRGDLCNSGTLVPDPQTLYVLPPATESTTTDFFPTTS